MNETLFEKIISGDIPSIQIYKDDICIVILDKFPTTEGQVLIIPLQPIDYIFDLDSTTYSHCFTVAKKIATAIDSALQPIRTCIVVEGFEVPHAHIKLFPVYKEQLEINGGKEASDEVLQSTAKRIKEKL
jgi:histidine triad (HIT) family protein